MIQKFCTACGAALSEGKQFCEHCGSPQTPGTSTAPVPQLSGAPGQVFGPATSHPSEGKGPGGGKGIAVVLVILVVTAGALLLLYPKLSGTMPSSGPVATVPPGSPVSATTVPVSVVTTAAITEKPVPFPGALAMNERFGFGSGPVASNATVYRYWMNDTYQWHNDMDNRYYEQKPTAGNKYLFIFVHMENNGDTRVWFPPSGSVTVISNGASYARDPTHYLPDKSTSRKSRPVEVKEVEYIHKLNGDEYAEDFGYSHGNELAYLYPGISNAVDGYIIFEVPLSLVPQETCVTIPFNAKDQGVWKLE